MLRKINYLDKQLIKVDAAFCTCELVGDTFDELGLARAHEYWYVTDLGLELVLTHKVCLQGYMIRSPATSNYDACSRLFQQRLHAVPR